ncbi:MAG: FKBP-type peptidyl-prolyl cis-trans isomerase [Candidatus Saccharimonadales bacterium]
MARKRDRIFALVMALAFLLTTVGVSVALIMQIVQEGRNKSSEQIPETTTKNNPNALQGKNMDSFTPIAKIEKLEAIDTKPGDGDVVKAGDTVTVDYTGAVAATGVVFQSSLDTGQPISFGLDGVIDGWKEGMPGMKVGGTRRLLIPAVQAYGANPPQGSGIPANADLVFDIVLHKIGK